MWKRHFQIISIALLSFSVIIHGEYSDNTSVLSNCHVTINVSSWFISGSCFVSSTFHGYQCYWIREQERSKDVLPKTLKKQNNGDQYTGICSFRSSLPKEGKYRYYIFSEPQPTNPYSYNMIISELINFTKV
ncbi:uncharacterized protein LOC112567551 [Pomacea canaliculata]|uniref:uncharacterized protein LOC112567551 n=1 Tax=Pomacea canaliculata TaxID=400727 RepID=UPI000D72E153|nr:uncharacterized protein LOC112567551 [Pomacea canaliculata]